MTATPEQSSSSGSMLVGLVVGAVIGATAALLYAPKPGKETREEMLERMQELKVRLDDTTQEMRELARTKYAETKADISQAVEAGRAAAKARAQELRQKAGLG